MKKGAIESLFFATGVVIESFAGLFSEISFGDHGVNEF